MKRQIIRLSLLTAMFASSIAVSAGEYVPKIIAGVVRMDSWTSASEQREGIYQLEAVPGGTLTQLSEGRDVYMAPLGGAVYEDGKMKGIHFRTIEDPFSPSGVSYAIYSVEYDMATWTRTKFKSLGDLYGNLISSCGVTKDPVTGLNYGIFFNFNMNYEVIDRKFCTIDYTPDTPKKSQICVMGEQFSAIAAAPNGRLYGVSREGYFYTINKSTGSLTLIGDLYLSDISANPSSMTFDPRTEKLYWCYVSTTGKSYLYEINYTIGEIAANRIMQVPDNAVMVNMYIAAPEAEDSAPAAVSDLAVSFAGESLTGTVSFTLPSKSYDDTPLTGALDYTIYADGEPVATGSAGAGTAVTEDVTVAGGDITFKVTASNAGGEGAPTETTLYVGPDTPLAVTNAAFTYDRSTQTVTLTWDAPTTGIHGIALNPANLTYRIVRKPIGTVAAAAHTATSFTETLSDNGSLKAFWYEISAVNGSLTGENAATNKIVIGQPVTLPYNENFNTQNGFDICTVIDVNQDGATWERYHYTSEYSGTANYARITAHNDNGDDDWLLLPPMNLQKGAIYSLKFDAKKQFLTADCNQFMEVAVGMGEDPDQYINIMDPTSITNVNFSEYAATFTVPENGIYHIGFHALSEAASAALDIDKVAVRIETSGNAPAAVTSLVFTPDPTGELQATLSFTTPAKALSGEALESLTRVEVTDSEGSLVGTKTDVEPGKSYTAVVTGLANGYETYTVRAVNTSGKGAPVETRVFIGQDVPSVPRNIMLTDNGEEAVLSWEAPTTGVNGLYVNPQKMTYNLYTYNDYGTLTSVADNITSPWSTGVRSNEGDQNLLYYALRAETTGGESDPVATNGLIVGAPYTLPYAQSFANAEWGDYYVWLEGEYADWNIGLTRNISSDNDGGAVAFIPNRSDFGNFNLGKVSLANTTTPTLTFDCYVYPGTTSYFSVAVDKFPQGVAETLATVKYENETVEGWKPVSVDLSRFVNEPFVLVKFAMASSSREAPIVLDNIRIEDTRSGLGIIGADGNPVLYNVYSIEGRAVRLNATGLDGLSSGFYIINGKKVFIK